jgi:ABC-type thiamin/hydroxymethylpyrimidine transport system permease subunit
MDHFSCCYDCWSRPLVLTWDYAEWKLLWFLAALLIAVVIRPSGATLRRHLAATTTWMLPSAFISSDIVWAIGRVVETLSSAPWLIGSPY